MDCDCSEYEPISLDRASINRRIKQSKAIRNRLELLAVIDESRLFLFRCPDCGQYWQSGYEWNFGGKEYLFQVPEIDVAEWQREPFRQPAAMMIYSAAMEIFFSRNKFETGDSPCRASDCTERAIRFSVYCRDHHIESLQQKGQLLKPPTGRLFPPYYVRDQGST